jgi:chromate transporter
MPSPPFPEFLRVFGRIGLLSFGGPAGQIALMHRELVEDRNWVDEDQFLRALNFCHLLPGPEAQQLATWIGWRLHGVKGGLAGGLLFILPGAAVMLGLSILYVHAADLAWFDALFLGIKAAVLAIVLQALLRVAGRALNTRFKVALAVASFIALFFLKLPFPLVVLGAGILGMIAMAWRPEWLKLKPVARNDAEPAARSLIVATLRTIALWLIIWAAPMMLVLAFLGPEHIFWKIGLFFSQLAVVTFGGAYAVLSYMAQEAVQSHHWLTAGEMANGLGLAETTPGPLIMVTQFVGFFGAFRSPAPFSPMVAGTLGAALTTWVTFAPCFLWILAFAPWMDRLARARRLQAALAALTAAVVGVIANLMVWFALHVLFARVGEYRLGWIWLYRPDWSSGDWRVGLIGAASAVLLFRLRVNLLLVLAGSALAGLALSSVSG